MFVKIPNYDDLPEPENGNGEDGRPSLYWLVFLILLSSRIWYKAPGLDMSGLWTAANIRIGIEAVAIATGWTAALALVNAYIWPGFVAWWRAGMGGQRELAEAQVMAVPALPPPKPATAPPPQINDNGDEPRRAEVTAAIWTNGRQITIADQTVDLGDYQVSREQWNALAKARRRGQFGDISLNSLHDVLGIDRKIRAGVQDSDAHRVIGLLLDLELIRDGGERRPYLFTALGESVLPPHPNRQAVAT